MSNLLSENFRAYSSPKFLHILPNYKKILQSTIFYFNLTLQMSLNFF